MKISIIVLTSDSSKNKGYCVKHCLTSIWQQKVTDTDLEVIIVENSSEKDLVKIEELNLFTNSINSKFSRNIEVKIVDANPPLSRGHGRNLGVSKSKNELLVFIDDDTIIYNDDALSQIQSYAETSDYGYGANRFWTKPKGWFEENSASILENMLEKKDPFASNIGYAEAFVRGSNDTRLLNYSFISNFGYCKRDLFDKVGGFPNFPGCDLEDDYLTYRCYKESGIYHILFYSSVIHVTHDLKTGDLSNISVYYDLLNKDGYFWFNVGRTFEEESPFKESVLQKLREYHPDYRLEESYEYYKNSIPANIDTNNEKDMAIWKEKNRYSMQDYSIVVNSLLSSQDLNQFVKQSQSDFDNLIPVIQSLINSNLVEISVDGKIRDLLQFKYFPNRDFSSLEVFKNPNNGFNQFPCDLDSRNRRIQLLKERFPLTDHLKVALLGDDDLLSVSIAQERWLEAITLEVDQNILSLIKGKFNNVSVIECDFRVKNSPYDKYVKTFIADPPYTLHGAMLFVYKGLQLLNLDGQIQEFYLVLNPTMIGTFMNDLHRNLSDCGIWIHQIRNNFSHYELPSRFEERNRANAFLEQNKIDIDSLTYSSSSNLYILRTISPDLEELWKKINLGLIYKHFI